MVYFLDQIYSVYLFNYLSPTRQYADSSNLSTPENSPKHEGYPAKWASEIGFFRIVFRKLGMSPP